MLLLQTGHYEAAQQLLSQFGGTACNIDAREDREGRTALALAAESTGGAVVDALLVAGADPQAPDSSGNSVLMRAIRDGRLAVARRLVAHCADVAARNAAGEDAMALLLEVKRSQLLRRSSCSSTPQQFGSGGLAVVGSKESGAAVPAAAGANVAAAAEVDSAPPPAKTQQQEARSSSPILKNSDRQPSSRGVDWKQVGSAGRQAGGSTTTGRSAAGQLAKTSGRSGAAAASAQSSSVMRSNKPAAASSGASVPPGRRSAVVPSACLQKGAASGAAAAAGPSAAMTKARLSAAEGSSRAAARHPDPADEEAVADPRELLIALLTSKGAQLRAEQGVELFQRAWAAGDDELCSLVVPAMPAAALGDLQLDYQACSKLPNFGRTAASLLVRGAELAGADWRGAQDGDGSTHLMLAAAAPGDTTAALCVALAAAGIGVNATNKDGDSALFLAARAGNLAVCRALVEKGGADALLRNNRNRTAGSQLKLPADVHGYLSGVEAAERAARAERTKVLFDAKLRQTQTANGCAVRAV
jgi:ankyrin repeat protein